jgi:hypothetical protein
LEVDMSKRTDDLSRYGWLGVLGFAVIAALGILHAACSEEECSSRGGCRADPGDREEVVAPKPP